MRSAVTARRRKFSMLISGEESHAAGGNGWGTRGGERLGSKRLSMRRIHRLMTLHFGAGGMDAVQACSDVLQRIS
jgi:hypothetical protein